MRIAVLVKHVPDPLEPVVLTDGLRVDRSAGMLCSLDEYAVDQALRLRGATGSRVVAVTMGPPAARSAVTRALQMGADEGLHVTDPALAGSDVIATATVLAAAVRRLGDVGLVVCGMASTDAGGGAVPVLVADLLGWGCATHAAAVTLGPGGADEPLGTLTVARDDTDARRTLRTALPAVVSVTDLCGEPAFPSFKGILAAKRRPVEVLGLGDLGLAGVGTRGLRTQEATPAAARPPALIVTDRSGSGAAALVELLGRCAVAGVSS